jgi:hypothetical protein
MPLPPPPNGFLADHHVDAPRRIGAVDVRAELALQHARPDRLADPAVQNAHRIAQAAGRVGHALIQ